MKNINEIKEVVKEKYSQIANSSFGSGCCGPVPACCGDSTDKFTMIGDDYKLINGYVPEADLGLGCGLPTEHANINEGDTVVDLGCGAGNDVFIARTLVGSRGKVIGVDMTEEMIERANKNKQKLGFENVEFILGDIENIPLNDETANVVISNCVLNLVPNKQKAFSEIYRILKPNGHFCVSDIVVKGKLPDNLKESAEMYAGCVAGAIDLDEYLKIIENAGFKESLINKTKVIDLPNELLKLFLSKSEIEQYRSNHANIVSVTVTAYK